jgi:hypothetical protein
VTASAFVWKCPNCGAVPDKHGSGDCVHGKPDWDAECMGLGCCCINTSDHDKPLHSEASGGVCYNAYCWHCSWSGTIWLKRVKLGKRAQRRMRREQKNGVA